MQHDPNDVRRAANIFKALSHPHRLQITCCLSDGRTCTQKELVEEFGWPQPTMARHLAKLRDAGLIMATRDGQEVRLQVAGPLAKDLMTAVCQWVHPETGESFAGNPVDYYAETAS
jgi:ArsR family transcriptional regulator